MDKAQELKKKYDRKEIVDFREAKVYLDQSVLFQQLLEEFDYSVVNLLWRLTQLAEIPFSGEYEQVKNWLDKLITATYTGEAFSLTGKTDYVLACYNGMIISIMLRLNSIASDKYLKGIEWILKYQHVKRGEESKWSGTEMLKHGGCMKSTPCYMGLVKSMLALSDYKQSTAYVPNLLLEDKLEQGLEYILNQNVYTRISDGKPIARYIINLTYPFTWKTNIVELLRLLKQNGLLNDDRTMEAKSYLEKKRKKDGYWWSQSEYIHKNKAWIPFDKSREEGKWLSYEINKLI